MSGKIGDFTANWLHICIVSLSFLVNTSALSVEPRPGEIYPGGSQIDAHDLGFQFGIPNNWKGGLEPSGEIFLMEPQRGGAILVVVAETMPLNRAYELLQGPVEVPEVGQLVVKGKINRAGNVFSGKYDVSFNPALAAEVRAKSAKNGTSIAFFLVSERAKMVHFRPQLDQVFDSLRIKTKKPVAQESKHADGSPASTDKTWLSYLKGKHIVRFFTGSGYTEEQHIWLCSNGQYLRRFDSGGFGGGASGAFQGNYDGTWTATGEGERGELMLNAVEGQVVFNLRWDYGTNRLYVDGKRWLHDKNNVCN